MNTNITESSTSLWFNSEEPYLSKEFTDITFIYQSAKGYTALYRASRMGKYFMLKALIPELSEDMFYRSALQKEFDIGYHLLHPYVVQTIGMEEVPDIGLCIVLEWIEGQTLRKWLTCHPSLHERLRIARELCEVLSYLHAQSILHRDLKPENIMITTNGSFVKLIDFGCSDADYYKILKAPAGTRHYAAPELFDPNIIPDGRADLFALGIIFKEMNSPWWKGSWRLAHIGRKCSRKERSRRYNSAQEVNKALTSTKVRTVSLIIFVLLLTGGLVWRIEQKNSAPNQIIQTPTLIKDTLYIVQTDTIIQQHTDTVLIEKKNYIEQQKEKKELQKLIAFTREYTLQEMEKASKIAQDTSISEIDRTVYGNNMYFAIENRIKKEVSQFANPNSLEYTTYLNLAITQMTQTMKEYNAKHPYIINKQ